jgi:uncharacterized protein involved in exopolysaccharide biosynthesis
MGPFQSFEDISDMLRRRWWLILVIAVAGVVASFFFALGQQHLYRSAVVIQISQPTIADDLASSTVEGSSARRLQQIEQRLMARDSVLEIIRKHGLYQDIGDQRPSNLVFLFRSSVRIEGVAAAREGFSDDGTISILTITAEMSTGQQAWAIADEISQRTVELSRQARIEQARETLTFVARQEGVLVQELSMLENEMADFRKANNVVLSTSAELHAAELSTLNEGLLDIARDEIEVRRAAENARLTERPATARRMLAEFDERLATLDAQRDLLMVRKVELEKLLETTPEVQGRLEAFERQIEQIREQLGAMRARRTEAEIGFRLESAGQSERLTILEPATIPEFPFTGSRKKLVLMGAAASILAGLGLAFLLELRDPVLRTAYRMERETGLKPVVTIPVVRPRRARGGLLKRLFRRRPASSA